MPDAYDEHAVAFVLQQQEDGRALSEVALLFRLSAMAAPVEMALRAEGIPHNSIAKAGLRWDPTALWIRSWLRVAASLGSAADYRETLFRPARYLSKPTIEHILAAGADHGVIEGRIAEGAVSAEGWQRNSEAQTDDLLEDALGEYMAAVHAARAAGPKPGRMLRQLRLEDALDASKDRAVPVDGTPPEAVLKVLHRLAAQVDTVEELEQWFDTDDDPDRMEALEADEAAEPEDDQVLLSTIHKVKGQEFPAVAVLGPLSGMPDARAQTHEQREEERRIAYVAVTRAGERLLVCCSDLYGQELSVSPTGAEWALYRAELEGGRPAVPSSAMPVSAPAGAVTPPLTVVTEDEPWSLVIALRGLWKRFMG
jgi:superfamily I DNA/RNA helicase